METTNDRIKQLETELAKVLGGELADSLVRAGRKRGRQDLDMQLVINDGLASMPQHKRLEVLDLIDSLMRKA